MGLGSTAKKIQALADRAEQLYAQVGELRDQLSSMRAKLDETHGAVTDIDRRQREQGAVIEAIAAELDVDVETVLTEAAIDVVDGEPDSGDGIDDDDPNAPTDAEASAQSPPE